MTGVGFSIAPSQRISIPQVLELARLSEVLGYDSVWIPETWGFDIVSLLALLAETTTTLRVGGGVFNVFSRSAAVIAQTAASLQEISGNRFLLGLGASGPVVIEDWHGVPYHRPVERTRDYVGAIRLALSGQRVDFTGTTFTLRNFTMQQPPGETPPIYIAALGPRNVRMAGEVADGWLPIFAARGSLSDLVGQFTDAAAAAGRDDSNLDIAAYIPALVGPRAERLLAQQIAYYVGAMGTFYAEYVARIGFAGVAAEICEKWQRGDRAAAVGAVGTELLDACTIGVDPGAASEHVRQYMGQGVRSPILTIPNGSTFDEAVYTLETLAPAVASP